MTGDEPVDTGAGRSPRRLGGVANLVASIGYGMVVVGGLGMLVGDLPRSVAGPESVHPWLIAAFFVSVVGLAAAAAIPDVRPWVYRVLAVCAAASGAGLVHELWDVPVWGVERLRGERGDYWTYGVGEFWFLAAVAAALVGAVLFGALRGGAEPVWRGRRTLLGAGAGGVVVVVAMAAVYPVGRDASERFVEHTTADGAGDAPPVPGSVEEVAWSWEPDDGLMVMGVDPGGPGAIVDLLDGVLALDTETGEEVWRYRHPGARVQTGVTSDGGTVVLSYPLPGQAHGNSYSDEDDGDLVAEYLLLDAATGAIAEERTITAVPEDGDRDERGHSVRVDPGTGDDADASGDPLARVRGPVRLPPYELRPPMKDLAPDHAVSLGSSGSFGDTGNVGEDLDVRVHELMSLEQAWRYSAEGEDADCASQRSPNRDTRAVVGGLVLVSIHCERPAPGPGEISVDLAVVALDLETGAERWRHTWEPEGEVTKSAMLRVSGPVHSDLPEPRLSGGLAESGPPRVAVSRTDEWHDGMVVLDVETGDVVAEDSLDEIEEPGEPDEPDPAEPVGLDGDSYYLRERTSDTGGRGFLHRMDLDGADTPEASVELTTGAEDCAVLAEEFACVRGTRFGSDEDNPDIGIETAGFGGGGRRVDLEPAVESELRLASEQLGAIRLEPAPGALLVVTDGYFGSGHPADLARFAEESEKVGLKNAPTPGQPSGDDLPRPPIIALR
ncbi:outer membrane protein assembly factor BamB [Lipingzhangella halophila]|uniref:Outer membrane protein assembly factor BamB n=1 Tax=Lipingzhangella halophila TaxID=1783352 RepID=A0A7W7RJK7_9ACTN|nr:PQQ-binding-like beta-propeller repeat protein [Lipingzhangella halophila]MBB4933082.1 outer membrane protein assembly factor BamB [Lipingzhangella halophila]